MIKARPGLVHIGLASAILSGCGIRGKVVEQKIETRGGAEAIFVGERKTAPADIGLDTAYGIEAMAWGMTYPTSIILDDAGRIYVVEAGYAYGVEPKEGRIIRLDSGNKHVEIAKGPGAPWTGASFHKGSFYVSAGGTPASILKISLEGKIDTLVGGLPPMADHHTNRPVVGPDGYVYFPQGVTTNSGVIGPDNVLFGWMKDNPGLHDIPARDIILAGRNFTDEDLLTADPADKKTTGAFVPYGTRTEHGQKIPGRLPATGAIMRVPLGGGALELVAWGLRNPFGLAFAPDGKLYATENGFDMRGSRPIAKGPDVLWRIESGAWYGWPDFAAGIPVTDPRFKPKDGPQPEFLLAEHPQTPPKPVADLGVHTVANGLDFSRSEKFGFVGEAFIALFGDMTPLTGVTEEPAGFQVIRVNPKTGAITPFLVNKGKEKGPASKLESGGLERPIDLRFDGEGNTLYVLDFGVMTYKAKLDPPVGVEPQPRPGTGVLWKVWKKGATGSSP